MGMEVRIFPTKGEVGAAAAAAGAEKGLIFIKKI